MQCPAHSKERTHLLSNLDIYHQNTHENATYRCTLLPLAETVVGKLTVWSRLATYPAMETLALSYNVIVFT